MLTLVTTADKKLVNDHVIAPLKKADPHCEYRLFSPPDNFFDPAENEVVLYMGDVYFKAAQARGYIPKNRNLSSQRGKILSHKSGASMIFTYSPNIINFDRPKKSLMSWDIKLAERISHAAYPFDYDIAVSIP